MKKKHPQYNIKPGDTITNITQLFDVEEKVWLQYHNNMCSLDDIILNNKIPKHLKEIYLLPELWNKESELNTIKPQIHPLFNEQEKIILYNKDILFFAPYNINNRYGVIMEFGKNKIHYEIDIKFVGHLNSEIFRICIDRKQVYINNEEPNSKLYRLADMMTKAIYPIELDINDKRKIKSIANYQEIKKRSIETRKKISQYYVGEYAEKYVQLFDTHISNPNILINNLENELFYQLFFLPIQGRYSNNLMRRTQYQHLSNKRKQTTYNLNVQLKQNYTDSGKIFAKIFSDEEIDKQKCFEAEYRLYPEDHSIFSMRGNFILLNDENKKNNTYFEIFHINSKDRIIKKNILNSTQLSILDEYNTKPTDTKKKNNFWNFFK